MDSINEEGANIAQTAIEAGKRLAPKVVTNPVQDGKPFVVLDDGTGKQRIQFLEERFEAPARKIGTVALNDAPSL